MAKATTVKKDAKTTRKKVRRVVNSGSIYIQSSFNNTMITVTDEKGGIIAWASAGSLGFKGTKKSTPYAAQLAATAAIEKARGYGLREVRIFVSGVGSGRESAVRALTNSSLIVSSIKDTTPIAHNGCRAKKPRRV